MRVEHPHVSLFDLLVVTEALQNNAQALSSNALQREVNALIELAHGLCSTDAVLANTLDVASSLVVLGKPESALRKLHGVLERRARGPKQTKSLL
jgi:hypothetical protein